MRLRKLEPRDREGLEGLLQADDTFRPDELTVARELIDAAIDDPAEGYRILVCEDDAGLVGYICFGQTPMTDATFDLYWVVTHPRARGQGVATRLIRAMEDEVKGQGARIVRIETSTLDGYDAARSLYARLEYHEAGRIRDFYRLGDDLIILSKRLDAQVRSTAGPKAASQAQV